MELTMGERTVISTEHSDKNQQELIHTTVLLNETVELLNVVPEGIYVDCTLGGGGHSALICSRLNASGLLIGIDQDRYALAKAKERLTDFPCRKIWVKNNFVNLDSILNEENIAGVNGLVYDLGVSSFQFDDAERGFSYQHDGLLDMRMDADNPLTAHAVVNTYSYQKLRRVIAHYGEEKYAASIAKAILRARETAPIETTIQLSELIKSVYPAAARRKAKHPARKTFQAIRLEVNHELDILSEAINKGITALKTGGRMAVITFHSMEDRLVKTVFNDHLNPCICPPDLPVCGCGRKPDIRLVTRKPIAPTTAEINVNRRSRSAKLRVIEKCD